MRPELEPTDVWRSRYAASVELRKLVAESTRQVGRLSLRHVHALVPVAIAGVWLVDVRGVGIRGMSDYGLVSVLPWSHFALLGLLTSSFVLALTRRQVRTLVALAHVGALVFMLYAVTAIVEDEPRFAVTYRHAGIVDYIAQHHSVNEGLDAYFSWPGFFSFGVLLTGAMGVGSPLAYAAWAPLFFSLLSLPALWLLLRWASDDDRVIWLSIWVFFASNWVAQDYLAPQAMAFVLWLAMLAALLYRFGTQPWIAARAPVRRALASVAQLARGAVLRPPASVAQGPRAHAGDLRRVVPFLLIVLMFAAMTTGHQLTPFAALLTGGALVVFGRVTTRALPVLLAVILLGWISYMTTTYLAGHIHDVFGSVSLSGNLSTNVAARVEGSSGHLQIVRLRLLMTVLIWVLAAAGLWRRYRNGRLDLALGLVWLSPFALLVAQPYGGEMLLRVFLFSLPAVSYFAATLVYPSPAHGRAAATTGGVLVVACLLLAGFQFTRYGNERVDSFTRGDAAAVSALYRLAPAGSTLVGAADNVPWKYRGYAAYHYTTLTRLPGWRRTLKPDPARVIAQFQARRDGGRAYVIATRSMRIQTDTYSGKEASFDRIVTALRRSSLATLLYARGGAQVFRLGRDPFAYEPDRPLRLRYDGAARVIGRISVRPLHFVGAGGRRVNGLVFVPRRKASHPAVLFLHGSGGPRAELRSAAAQLAARGAVTLTISQPESSTFGPLVFNARRALDVLAARRDVDRSRFGLVGYSRGGQTASILAGIEDTRLRAIGIVAARDVPLARRWIRHTSARLFFQAGLADRQVPRARLRGLMRDAPGRPRIRWYPSGHDMSAAAYRDQIRWQADMLGLR